MSRCQYSSEQYLPFNPDVPDSARRQADEVSDGYDRRTRESAAALAGKIDAVVDRARHQARELLGAENWVALRRRMRDERVQFRDLLQPPAGLKANYDQLSAARKEKVQQYLNSLKVDADKLRGIYRDMSAAVAKLRPAADVRSGHAEWLNREHLQHVHGGHTKSDVRSAFQTFRPPYPTWQEGHSGYSSSGFHVSRVHNRNEFTGLVGHDVRLDNNNASDFDNGWMIADTQIAFWYLPPQTGVVEVIVEGRCGRGLHELRIADEWGTSDSSTTHWNYLMMHVLHPNVSGPSFAWMSHFNWNTDVSGFIQREFLTQGGVYTAQLFSDGPVPANQWIMIRAGTRSQDGSITNDMEINSLSVFRWFLQAVHVRIAA
jgi:hypothetical protein